MHERCFWDGHENNALTVAYPVCLLVWWVCSLLEEKVDQLTEMMAELTRRLQGGD